MGLVLFSDERRLIQVRIAIVAPFSELRHFPHGVHFKQWTGDDSKALMKVGDLYTQNPTIIFLCILDLFTGN